MISSWRASPGLAWVPSLHALEAEDMDRRSAVGRLLAESRSTAKEIMVILGRTTLAEAERYTEDADQALLAESAIVRLEGHRVNVLPQTTPANLGKAVKKPGKSK